MKKAIILGCLLRCQLAYGNVDSLQQYLSVSPYYKTASPEWIPSLSREGLFNTMPGLLANYARNFYGANFWEVQAAFGSRKYKKKGAFIFNLEEGFTSASLSAGIGSRIQVARGFVTSVVVSTGVSKGRYASESINGIESLVITQVFIQIGIKSHVRLLPKWSLSFSSQYRIGRFNWGDGFEKANAYLGGMFMEYLGLSRRF